MVSMGAPAVKDHCATRSTIRVPAVDVELLAVARGEIESIAPDAPVESAFPGPRDDDDPLCIRFADPADPYWLDALIPRKARPLRPR